jgi:3'-phosphoadenosine 5'-phosphosulfate sulfotransferase (PAPS reductase)/FAD synthetase
MSVTLAAAPVCADPKPDLGMYDYFLVAFSGGKDSLAAVLHLLESGVPKDRIELWHHEIDGREGSRLMDWPSTPAYCRAVGKALGIPVYFSWKVGGFEREMLRFKAATAPTRFQTPDGEIREAGGKSGKLGTRRQFPQTSADLSVRWCSAYLKVDVGALAIRNQERFNGKRTLFISGERAQESPARAKYKTFETDRSDARDGASGRHVDHWRPIHLWSEQEVWGIIRRHRVVVHPAYRLGWGRLSCRLCIFGSPNQWASALAVDPGSVHKLAGYEVEFGKTIDRNMGVMEKAGKGCAYAKTADRELVAEALDENWDRPVFVDDWQFPAGAFGEGAGPS